MAYQLDTALKMIPEFDGRKENLHKFIACCDIVGKGATTRDHKESFLNVIKTKLSGSAYNLIKYKTFESWDGLKTILQNQYLEKRTMAQIQSELLNSKQLPSEDILTFANRIERLSLDLTDACVASEGEAAYETVKNLNEKSALRAFVEGLRDPIKLIVKASRFDNFHDAVAAACEEERTQKVNKVLPWNKGTIYNQKFNQNKPKCFICGKPNHKANQCYLRKSEESQNFQPKRERSTNINTVSIICRYCRHVGHGIEECRKRQYNNNRKRDYGENKSSSNEPRPSTSSGNGQGSSSSGRATQIRDLKNAH